MNTDREFEIKGDLNDLSLAPYAQLVDPAFDLRRGYNTGGFLSGPSLALKGETSLRTLS